MLRALYHILAIAVLANGSTALAADTHGWFGFDAKAAIQGTPGPDPVLASLQVESVTPASPAAMAGLTAGDEIVGVQGTTINGTHATALRGLMQKAAGESITLVIRRNSAAPRTVTLTAVSKPRDEK